MINSHSDPLFSAFSLQITKKRRVIARAQCKNIKNECPKPTCDEPVLMPGKCCKVCPGETMSKSSGGSGQHSSMSPRASATQSPPLAAR